MTAVVGDGVGGIGVAPAVQAPFLLASPPAAWPALAVVATQEGDT